MADLSRRAKDRLISAQWRERQRASMPKLACDHCRKLYAPDRPSRRFCSSECGRSMWRETHGGIARTR